MLLAYKSTTLLLPYVAADVGPALKLVAAVRQVAMTKQPHDTGGLRMMPLLLLLLLLLLLQLMACML
jgi:hypothetical protein